MRAARGRAIESLALALTQANRKIEREIERERAIGALCAALFVLCQILPANRIITQSQC